MRCSYKYGVIVAFLMVFVVSGCALRRGPEMKGKEPPSDVWIQSSIDADLLNESLSIYQRVSLKVFEGRVLIAGYLDTKAHHDRTIEIIKKTPGVREVLDASMVGPSRSIGTYMADSVKATNAAANLLAEKGVISGNVKVEVVDAVIYLLGKAATEEERQKMIDAARKVDGAKKVIAFVDVKKDK